MKVLSKYPDKIKRNICEKLCNEGSGHCTLDCHVLDRKGKWEHLALSGNCFHDEWKFFVDGRERQRHKNLIIIKDGLANDISQR